MSQPATWRPSSVVLAAAITGVVVRLFFTLQFPGMLLIGDEVHFYVGAERVLAGQEVPFFPLRPPLYIFFSAAVLGLVDHSAMAIRIVQSILEGLTILGIGAIAAGSFGRRAAGCAAWFAALYPDFISYSHYLWSETVFLFLLVSGILALQWFARRPGAGASIAVGSLFGALTLVKPFHIYMLPVLLGWGAACGAASGRRRRIVLGLAATAIALAVTIPWSAVISKKEGRFVYVCTVGQFNLRNGTNYYAPQHFDFPDDWRSSQEVRKREGRREGLLAFIARNPRLFASRASEKMVRLWTPNSFLIRHVYSGKYGAPQGMSPAVRHGVIYLSIGATALLIMLAVLGACVAREPLFLGTAALYSWLYVAMICLTPSQSRYRLPLMVFAIVLAAIAVIRWREIGQRLRRPWIGGAAAAALFVLALLWWSGLSVLLPAIW